MELDLARIKKISLISIAALFVIELICFFITSRQMFFSILTSGLLTYIFFIGTLFFYFKAYRSKTPGLLKYTLPIFIGKLALSALAFFLVYRFNYVDMMGFIFSFLIFFTIFLNLEVFLIYKKVLFYRN